jgi:hypothetical protein
VISQSGSKGVLMRQGMKEQVCAQKVKQVLQRTVISTSPPGARLHHGANSDRIVAQMLQRVRCAL